MLAGLLLLRGGRGERGKRRVYMGLNVGVHAPTRVRRKTYTVTKPGWPEATGLECPKWLNMIPNLQCEAQLADLPVIRSSESAARRANMLPA